MKASINESQMSQIPKSDITDLTPLPYSVSNIIIQRFNHKCFNAMFSVSLCKVYRIQFNNV